MLNIKDYTPKILTVDGNIGSGKSTFIQNFKQYINNYIKNINIIFVQEPIDEWNNITDKNGDNILSNFYKDQEKYAFSFQIMAIITRYKKLTEAINEAYTLELKTNKKTFIVVERSIITDKHIFAKMLYNSNKIDEINYKIYCKWYDIIEPSISIYKMLYIYTLPNICHERINNRNRSGEEEININYLNSCNEYHDIMIDTMEKKGISIYKINCNNNNLYDNIENTYNFFNKIYEDIFN